MINATPKLEEHINMSKLIISFNLSTQYLYLTFNIEKNIYLEWHDTKEIILTISYSPQAGMSLFINIQRNYFDLLLKYNSLIIIANYQNQEN